MNLFQLDTLAPGDPGAEETLLTMRQLIVDATKDGALIQDGRALVAAESRDPDDVIEAIDELLRTRVRYVDDPPFLELLQAPAQLLTQLRTKGRVDGDCDDVAILAAFLGLVHGLPFRLRAVGFRADGPLAHVYTLLRVRDQWVMLDTTSNRLWPSPQPVRALELDG